nr:unnamed protein product [Callosobruchus analis]
MLSEDSSEKYLITLKKVCSTRWSSRNDALLAVNKIFLLIMKTLYQLNLISNKKYEREECKSIINILESFDFLVLVTFFSSLFEIINPLSTVLQNENNDLQKSSEIILDTTQDLSKVDQLSVVFRYISVTENDDNVPKEIKICESFLGFIAVTGCSAAGLKTVILNLTKEYGIDLTKCRGQTMEQMLCRVCMEDFQTLIKEHAPSADYVHCAVHALNLVLNDAARHVRDVSTFFDNLEKIYIFFWQ